MSVSVQEADFDLSAEVAALSDADTGIGAIATFIGKVRGEAHGNKLQSMSLEHYPGMTEAELARIEAAAVARFHLTASRIIHRIGALQPGDNIVLVIACAPHRHNAISACDFLMDYLKTEAPFWKKETGGDGHGSWVDARETDDAARSRWHSGDA
ncbi:MAG: molybdenum cofactor biosynthesis protein MoaE [Hyphomicrobium sp.]|nr:molybdenum cofactor biosynthesis protein MoaE [Hyphomicrobium sp.]